MSYSNFADMIVLLSGCLLKLAFKQSLLVEAFLFDRFVSDTCAHVKFLLQQKARLPFWKIENCKVRFFLCNEQSTGWPLVGNEGINLYIGILGIHSLIPY